MPRPQPTGSDLARVQLSVLITERARARPCSRFSRFSGFSQFGQFGRFGQFSQFSQFGQFGQFGQFSQFSQFSRFSRFRTLGSRTLRPDPSPQTPIRPFRSIQVKFRPRFSSAIPPSAIHSKLRTRATRLVRGIPAGGLLARLGCATAHTHAFFLRYL